MPNDDAFHKRGTDSLINDWYIARAVQNKVESISRWCLLKSTAGVMFIYIDDDVSVPPRTVHISNEMSIELRLAGRLASFPVYEKAKCFNDIFQVLLQVPCLNICTGSDGNGDCPAVYFIKKAHSSSNRCEICQEEHRKEHDRRQKKEKRLRTKKTDHSKTIRKLRQAIKRRDEKIASLKQDIDDLIMNSNALSPADF